MKSFVSSWITILAVMVLPPSGAYAQEGTGDNILLTTMTDGKAPVLTAGMVPQSEGLEIVYDPKDFPLSPEEKDVFNAKKQKFITRFRNTLKFLHLKETWINKAVAEVETKFNESAPLIARSNTLGGTVSFSVNGGLALPHKIVERLQGTRIGRFIPQNGGFYYLMGIGFGFVRQQLPDGRNRWAFESYVDVERLLRAFTGMAEAGVAGNYGVVYESREGKFSVNRSNVTYGGVAGSFRHGQNVFGWSATSGVSFPPFIGAVLVYTDASTRYYLFRVSNTGLEIPLLSSLKDFWLRHFRTRAVGGGALACHGVFR